MRRSRTRRAAPPVSETATWPIADRSPGVRCPPLGPDGLPRHLETILARGKRQTPWRTSCASASVSSAAAGITIGLGVRAAARSGAGPLLLRCRCRRPG